MKRSEILKNRQTWINRLKDPNSKKAKNKLRDGEGFCCLGHGCEVLLDGCWDNFDKYIYEDEVYKTSTPTSFDKMVGFWDDCTTTLTNDNILGWEVNNLVSLNDETDATPQQIGEYLESVIEGGDNTPFRPLSSYDE